jgi:hypothetical protein
MVTEVIISAGASVLPGSSFADAGAANPSSIASVASAAAATVAGRRPARPSHPIRLGACRSDR